MKIIDSKWIIKTLIAIIIIIEKIIPKLAKKAIGFSNNSRKELERTCWMIVHEYKHGAMPTEYDIREIDEELYLEVLRTAKEMI